MVSKYKCSCWGFRKWSICRLNAAWFGAGSLLICCQMLFETWSFLLIHWCKPRLWGLHLPWGSVVWGFHSAGVVFCLMLRHFAFHWLYKLRLLRVWLNHFLLCVIHFKWNTTSVILLIPLPQQLFRCRYWHLFFDFSLHVYEPPVYYIINTITFIYFKILNKHTSTDTADVRCIYCL